MSHSPSCSQAVILGLRRRRSWGWALAGIEKVIADKQGFGADTVELTAGFPEAHDITPGTPVRIRGVDAGQVIAVEHPDYDGPAAEVNKVCASRRSTPTACTRTRRRRFTAAGCSARRSSAFSRATRRRDRSRTVGSKRAKPFDMEEAVAEVRDLAKEAKGIAAEDQSSRRRTYRETGREREGPHHRGEAEQRDAREGARPRRRPVRGRPGARFLGRAKAGRPNR